jgi:hypothetical protein
MNLSGGSKISAALYTLFSLSCRQVTASLDLVHLLVVSGSVITMTDSISETALEQIGGQVVVRAAAGVHQGSQEAALHCHAQEALAKAHGFVSRLNLVLLKVSEIDLMRGVVVCAVRRPLCLA